MVWKCKENCAECCGIVPIKKDVVKKFEHLQQREVTQIVEHKRDYVIPLTKDNNCVFLSPKLKCVIYDHRPPICKYYGTIPTLPCPYIDVKGRKRSPAKIKRTQRKINHHMNSRLEFLKRIKKQEETKQND